MMTPKFRAYDKQTGKMFAVSELYFNGSGVRACRIVGQTSKSQYKKSDFMLAERFVLMQWTGLTSNDGTEIYDGDIVGQVKYDYDTVSVRKPGITEEMTDSAYKAIGEDHTDEQYDAYIAAYYDEAPLKCALVVAYDPEEARYKIKEIPVNDPEHIYGFEQWSDDYFLDSIDIASVTGNIWQHPQLLNITE